MSQCVPGMSSGSRVSLAPVPLVVDACRNGFCRRLSDLVNATFRAVVRWAATMLIGVGIGGTVALLGQPILAVGVGGLMLLVGGVIVGATMQTTWLLLPLRRPEDWRAEYASLLTPGLFRAVTAGFLGAGICVGGLAPSGLSLALAAAAGLVGLVLTRVPEPD